MAKAIVARAFNLAVADRSRQGASAIWRAVERSGRDRVESALSVARSTGLAFLLLSWYSLSNAKLAPSGWVLGLLAAGGGIYIIALRPLLKLLASRLGWVWSGTGPSERPHWWNVPDALALIPGSALALAAPSWGWKAASIVSMLVIYLLIFPFDLRPIVSRLGVAERGRRALGKWRRTARSRAPVLGILLVVSLILVILAVDLPVELAQRQPDLVPFAAACGSLALAFAFGLASLRAMASVLLVSPQSGMPQRRRPGLSARP